MADGRTSSFDQAEPMDISLRKLRGPEAARLNHKLYIANSQRGSAEVGAVCPPLRLFLQLGARRDVGGRDPNGPTAEERTIRAPLRYPAVV